MERNDEIVTGSNQKENDKDRSCYLEVFCENGVVRNFAKFTGKSESLFFIEKGGVQVFSCEFFEVSKDNFFLEHLWYLLL